MADFRDYSEGKGFEMVHGAVSCWIGQHLHLTPQNHISKEKRDMANRLMRLKGRLRRAWVRLRRRLKNFITLYYFFRAAEAL